MSLAALIVGLGNPGTEYRDTRHNAGFMLADTLAEKAGARWRHEKKFFADVAECGLGGRRVLLVKPLTFMNASGESVAKLAAYHKVPAESVIVLVDDADLPLGTLRLRGEGSPGGHHGLESVEQHLSSRGYPRLRIGIARPQSGVRDIAGHVLGRFGAEERTVLEKVLARGGEQVECWASRGVAAAMNLYNGTVG